MFLRSVRTRAAAVLAGLLLAGTVSAQPQAPRPVAPEQVSASAWFVQGDAALGTPANRNFISNAGFVVTPAGVVVIDALGSPQLARELLERIARITPQPVTHVIVTHYHADHIYGLQEFRRRGAKILAHRAALEYLNSDTARSRLEVSRTELAPWIDAQTQLTAADEWIDGPRELVVGGVKLQIQPVGPAHTPEDLVVFLPSERVLFAGDMMFRGRVPFVGQADSRQWIVALNTLLAMDPKAPLKDPKTYTQVGRSLPRPDIPDKVTGRHMYVHDFTLPGMLHARVVRPPAVGARLLAVDEASISRLPGVRVVRMQDFLAVASPDEWAAIRAARELKAQWSDSATLVRTRRWWTGRARGRSSRKNRS